MGYQRDSKTKIRTGKTHVYEEELTLQYQQMISLL